jgi:hypothetical protein
MTFSLSRMTHDDALARPLAGGDGAHAHVDSLRADLEADAPVLRQALLGDVEAGHDLHARHDGRAARSVGAVRIWQSLPSMR